jgi:elongation factor Ts
MVTAADVKALREKTGLPLMDCKRALTEANGDAEAAVQLLRERGAKLNRDRADRVTEFGRFGLYFNQDPGAGAIVELKCESAPVTANEDFIALADGLAQQLATGPGADNADELLSQPSPTAPGSTLREQKDALFNRIREVFNVGRICRIDGPCAAYLHPGSTVHGVLLEGTGPDASKLRDICMHVAALSPDCLTVDDLDQETVENERKVLREAALAEGKPENIVDKMVEGRIRNFYAERVLMEQPFVKSEKESVGKFAKSNGIEVKRFVHWILGED